MHWTHGMARTWQLAVWWEYMILYTIFGGKTIYNNTFENRSRFDECNRVSGWSTAGHDKLILYYIKSFI